LVNLGILTSGTADVVLESVLSSIDSGRVKNVFPKIVVSTQSPIQSLNIASEKFGLETHVIPDTLDKSNRWKYDREIVKVLEEHMVTPDTGLVCLIGFRRILSPNFVKHFWMRIMNVHPSLLPSFPGLFAYRQAIKSGVKVTGVTVHFVTEKVDEGPIIAQKCITILEDDSDESLLARLLEKACHLYPDCINLFSQGRLIVSGRKVLICK
jgi:phosphoribosylglycinamide formyltransferase-1